MYEYLLQTKTICKATATAQLKTKKLKPINYNLRQTMTKILYYTLKCLKKTQIDYLLYEKKIINVSIYCIHIKKN